MADRRVVLDASALLALLLAEPGAEQVAARLEAATVSSVNWSEVVAKLAEHGMPVDAIRLALDGLQVPVQAFDASAAIAAGMLRPLTRPQGLSLGDRACLALALELVVPAVTADGLWVGLDLGIEVVVIR